MALPYTSLTNGSAVGISILPPLRPQPPPAAAAVSAACSPGRLLPRAAARTPRPARARRGRRRRAPSRRRARVGALRVGACWLRLIAPVRYGSARAALSTSSCLGLYELVGPGGPSLRLESQLALRHSSLDLVATNPARPAAPRNTDARTARQERRVPPSCQVAQWRMAAGKTMKLEDFEEQTSSVPAPAGRSSSCSTSRR
jgi:hypothetical protein